MALAISIRARSIIAICLLLSGCTGKGKDAPKLDPLLASQLNNQAVMLLEHDTGDALGAIDVLNRAKQSDPNNVLVRINLGIAYAATQTKFDEALTELNKAEQLGAKHANLRFVRGYVRFKKLDYAGAELDFRQVAADDPTDAFTHFHLGRALQEQGKNEPAILAFKEAIKLSANFQSAWNSLIAVLQRAGRRSEVPQAVAKVSSLISSKTGVSVDDKIYFAGVGRHMEPLPDIRVARKTAQGPSVSFTDESSSRIHDLKGNGNTSGKPGMCSAAWGDFDNDGLPDLLLCQNGQISLLHNTKGILTPVPSSSISYQGYATGSTWGDYDNDGIVDIAIYGNVGLKLFRGIGGGRFEDQTRLLPTSVTVSAGGSQHTTWIDFDHDGFLDLVVTGPSTKTVLILNGGGQKFTDVSQRTKVGTVSGATYVLPTDMDQNRAIDMLFLSPARTFVMINNYDGTFSASSSANGISSIGPAKQIVAADINADGRMDYVAATEDGVKLALQNGDHSFTIRPVVSGSARRIYSVSVADFDNDGIYDVVALAAPVSAGLGLDLLFYRGNGDGTFTNATQAAGLDRIHPTSSSRMVVGDIDGDGFADILIPGAQTLVLRNSGNANRWVRVSLKGLKSSPAPDHRKGSKSNGGGVGAVVEAWTDSTWLMSEVTAASGDETQPILGLGSSSTPRWLRVLWSSGVHQCEPIVDNRDTGARFDYRILKGVENKQPTLRSHIYSTDASESHIASFMQGGDLTDMPHKVNTTSILWEPNRSPTSCPVLYVWDGKKYRFVTDLQGGAIIGYNIGEYQYNVNDPDEVVGIPSGWLQPRNGMLDVEIADQLQEVLFIDAVNLFAVDHPASTTVFSNDRMLAAAPFPKFAPVSVDTIRPLKSAIGNLGEDVTSILATVDRKYPEDFAKLKYEGFTQRHTLSLDVGNTTGAQQVLLLMNGFQKYSHSSSNLAAAHVGVFGESPSLQVETMPGKWKTVIPDMGSIAGLPKWMTVDITPFIRKDNSRFRIVTNLAMYWDCIQVGLRMKPEQTRVVKLTPEKADYHALGYPVPMFPDGREPAIYDYDVRRDCAPWFAPSGNYTRPGDVTGLLQKPDDKYVIMHHGHALHVQFDPRKLPPLPAGWKRDYMLLSDGFGKDMDMNGAFGTTVGPLPFHKMSRYPYRSNEKYPDTPEYRAYQAEYNTVQERGRSQLARWPELHLLER